MPIVCGQQHNKRKCVKCVNCRRKGIPLEYYPTPQRCVNVLYTHSYTKNRSLSVTSARLSFRNESFIKNKTYSLKTHTIRFWANLHTIKANASIKVSKLNRDLSHEHSLFFFVGRVVVGRAMSTYEQCCRYTIICVGM